MKKILYAEDNDDVREVLAMKIMDDTGAEVVKAESGNKAIEFLKENASEIELIISDHNMYDGDGNDLYDYVQNQKLNIPFILMSGQSTAEILKLYANLEVSNVIEKPPLGTTFEDLVKKLLKGDIQAPEFMKLDYIPFKLGILYRAKMTPEDVFIKLAEGKYVHLYRKGTKLNKDDIAKYQNKGIEQFYVKNENFKNFLNDFIEIMGEVMLMEKTGITEKSAEVQYDVHELVHKQLNTIGISEAAIDLSKRAVESTIETVKSSDNLKTLLKNLNNKGPWIYEHSLFLSIVSSLIVEKMEWSSQDTLYKIHLSSFFHDLSLAPEYCDPKLIFELDRLSREEIKEKHRKYFDHPFESATIIYSIKGIPPDCNAIIAQSHERPDGTGFPKGMHANQSFPLACACITAHTFIDYLYQNGFSSKSVKGAFKEMDKTFLNGNYEKVYLALKSVF